MPEITKKYANELIAKSFICKEIFGIDPGKSNGAIAKYSDRGIETWNLNKFRDFDDMCDFWEYQASICEMPLSILEKITTYPEDAKNTGKMFQLQKLKEHYTELRASMRTNNIKFIEVMPHYWQDVLRIRKKGEDYNIRKRRHKDIAEDWFLGTKVTLHNCDALLLTQFAMHKIKYDPFWIRQNTKESTHNNLFKQKK